MQEDQSYSDRMYMIHEEDGKMRQKRVARTVEDYQIFIVNGNSKLSGSFTHVIMAKQ